LLKRVGMDDETPLKRRMDDFAHVQTGDASLHRLLDRHDAQPLQSLLD
jgi:hypothetical protein